eukprot:TRINITY_DN10858_c4_g1_i1.p1 TRINITY_DN10858_c4_g1~~TRINITY_DN10858_c4_g1_i1.p1  ORF type:complete len:324 (+),score=82.37 TRINITY_DN10858_c4_g1_i1:146-1117(+)
MGVSLAERLVKDRFAEFQRLATGTVQQSLALSKSFRAGDNAGGNPFGSAVGGVAPVAGTNSFMREFFTDVSQIQASLEKGRSKVKAMGSLLEEALQATTQDREQEVSEQLQRSVKEANEHVSAVKLSLESLKARSEAEAAKKPNSAENKIRTNMQQAMAKKHQQLLLDFQKAQVDYKKALERRQHKELAILMPEASEEERAEMIENGETTSLQVAIKMAGTHAALLDEVQRIREKHQDILRLERSIADLAQMFQEMAVLVEAQGEMLDAIEVHVHKTKGYTAKAEENLITTRKAQHKGRKWMCCITIVLMIVLLSVIFPLLIK